MTESFQISEQPANQTQARKLLTDELRGKVEDRVRELLMLSSKIWPQFGKEFEIMPTIRYDVKNRFGGFAITGGVDDWTIRLNLILCYENEDHFIEQTVGHEVAHLVTRKVFGLTKEVEENGKKVVKKVRSHGKEWRSVMINFNLPPETCHKYDTSSIDITPRSRSPRGAPLTPMQSMDMLKRLETGFRRLDKESKLAFIRWAETRVHG